MIIDVVSIFPDYLAPLGLSLVGKAREQGTVTINVHDLRQWTTDRHRTVDDTPLGGGAGMVMKPDVWGQALDSVFAHEELIAPHGDKEAAGVVSPDGAVTDGGESPPRRVLIIPTLPVSRFRNAMPMILRLLTILPWLVAAMGNRCACCRSLPGPWH